MLPSLQYVGKSRRSKRPQAAQDLDQKRVFTLLSCWVMAHVNSETEHHQYLHVHQRRDVFSTDKDLINRGKTWASPVWNPFLFLCSSLYNCQACGTFQPGAPFPSVSISLSPSRGEDKIQDEACCVCFPADDYTFPGRSSFMCRWKRGSACGIWHCSFRGWIWRPRTLCCGELLAIFLKI